MKIRSIYIFLLLIAAFSISAQVAVPAVKELRKIENPPLFSLGFGGNLSSVNVYRNYKENPYNLGWNARLTYNFKDNIRFMAEYNHTPKFNLSPTWTDIKSQSFVISANAVAYIKDQDVMVYTISGLCVQTWKGFYTGIQDFSTAKLFYKDNSYISNRNLCLDMGIGFERPFPGFDLYGDFRYRFANIDTRFGIIDATYNLGIKFPIITKGAETNLKKKRHSKKLFKGSDKYHWF